MAKQMNPYHWLTAYQVGFNQGIESYSEVSSPDDPYPPCILYSETNLERDIMKRDLIKKLSEEAKDIIRMIVLGPDEAMQFLYAEKYKTISKYRILTLLKKQGWKKKKIDKSIREIEKFAVELKEIDEN